MIWLTMAIVTTACLPDPLEVRNIPKIKPEIVVSSAFIPGESLVVFLSKSIGALEVSDNDDPMEVLRFISVNDAIVTIEGSFGKKPLLFLGYGFYGGIDVKFIEGEDYHLSVKSESLGEVTATTTALPASSFESVEVKKYFNGFDDTLAQVSYTLVDAEVKNNYIITVQPISSGSYLVERVLNPRVYNHLVDDEDFNGSEVISDTFVAGWQDYEKGDTVMVSLANISQEYADFIQLRLNNRVGIIEFASEPANYPTNVIGGRGFFNIYTPDIHFFVME
jgi:hypothetical protein